MWTKIGSSSLLIDLVTFNQILNSMQTRLLGVILSYQENYPWVPIQPHTFAKESLTGYNSLLSEEFYLC